MSRARPKERPLTPEELALSRRLLAEHGIGMDVTRRRILSGWPVGRLHEQPVRDPSRNARTRRQTPACKPKPGHVWRRWVGPKDKAWPESKPGRVTTDKPATDTGD